MTAWLMHHLSFTLLNLPLAGWLHDFLKHLITSSPLILPLWTLDFFILKTFTKEFGVLISTISQLNKHHFKEGKYLCKEDMAKIPKTDWESSLSLTEKQNRLGTHYNVTLLYLFWSQLKQPKTQYFSIVESDTFIYISFFSNWAWLLSFLIHFVYISY